MCTKFQLDWSMHSHFMVKIQIVWRDTKKWRNLNESLGARTSGNLLYTYLVCKLIYLAGTFAAKVFPIGLECVPASWAAHVSWYHIPWYLKHSRNIILALIVLLWCNIVHALLQLVSVVFIVLALVENFHLSIYWFIYLSVCLCACIKVQEWGA